MSTVDPAGLDPLAPSGIDGYGLYNLDNTRQSRDYGNFWVETRNGRVHGAESYGGATDVTGDVLSEVFRPLGVLSDGARIMSDGPSPEDALYLLPFFGLLRKSRKFKKVCELETLHSRELIEKSSDYKKIRNLSDKELLEAVKNPKKGDMLTINNRTGKLVDGNTRAHELQRRSLLEGSLITPDTEVPVLYHRPGNL